MRASDRNVHSFPFGGSTDSHIHHLITSSGIPGGGGTQGHISTAPPVLGLLPFNTGRPPTAAQQSSFPAFLPFYKPCPSSTRGREELLPGSDFAALQVALPPRMLRGISCPCKALEELGAACSAVKPNSFTTLQVAPDSSDARMNLTHGGECHLKEFLCAARSSTRPL